MSNATIMVISVTASTTQGQLLSEEELERIFEACNMAEELLAAKLKILTYVESRMAFIAPNVTAIIGKVDIDCKFLRFYDSGLCFQVHRLLQRLWVLLVAWLL